MPDGNLDEGRIGDVAGQISDLVRLGKRVVLVTSGAIGVGSRRLGLSRRPRTIPKKQAVAAVGQGLLMQAYEHAFLQRGIVVGQVLLTADDIADRRRHLNSRNTLLTLLELGTVPIVNENDTVAVDEIRFGDNDTLSALVATLIGADALVLLSDVDGLYSADPRLQPDAKLISVVARLTPEIEALAGGAGTTFSTGGMLTKLQAARIVTTAGIPMVLANGAAKDVLVNLIAGKRQGTLFLPRERPLSARKRWLAFHGRPQGDVYVDEGAVAALTQGGGSLLPAGVVGVDGRFAQGDLVRVRDEQGRELARGLVNYDAADLSRILGASSHEVGIILGYKDYDEVIHRDNLALARLGGAGDLAQGSTRRSGGIFQRRDG